LLERERDRIARDIHDDLGAGLTQLTLLGELVLRETPPGAATREQLDSLCGKSRRLLGTMDELVWTVNSRRDTVQDFAAFVCEHAQEYLASTPVRCRLDVPDDLPQTPLDLPARRNLLLAVKEAVRNAAKHSGGTELFLQIRVEDEKLVVTLEDNGTVFTGKAARRGRNGLRNMDERLSDIGGVCRVTATPTKGCRVAFSLPLRPVALTKHPFAAWVRKIFRRKQTSEIAE
jgi:signal transduction histidine kinase